MALQSSGAISFSQIQSEFGGSNPISLSEYYSADDGVSGSGSISVSQFYGRSRPYVANYTNISAYYIPTGAGGTGEGFWRDVASWTNNTNRKGSVRMWGHLWDGYWGPDSYGAWYYSRGSHVFGYRLYQNSYLLVDGWYGYHGATHPYWDFTTYLNRNDVLKAQYYGWGSYNNDKITGGYFNIGGS